MSYFWSATLKLFNKDMVLSDNDSSSNEIGMVNSIKNTILQTTTNDKIKIFIFTIFNLYFPMFYGKDVISLRNLYMNVTNGFNI